MVRKLPGTATKKIKAKKPIPSAVDAQAGYVRSEDAPLLPPPPSEVGVTGWLYKNIFASMSDFSSISAALKSAFIAVLTLLILYFLATQTIGLLDFAIFSAVWSDPEGLKRQACWTVEQGGALPAGWHAACWPFIQAKAKFIFYGAYPTDDLWRVNMTYAIGVFLLAWVLIERLPYRKMVGALLLTVYPVMAIVLLTGGAFTISTGTIGGATILGLALISIGRLGKAGYITGALGDLSLVAGVCGWVVIAFAVVLAIFSIDFDLEAIDTRDWGGLLITLVVAITGIVASLPLGILLALGRRSEMPVARFLSTVFIEFWRGVPLITVLFMASVMLPLFMPEGVNFDMLLRALIGVTLFSAAYMAEVVRGGLQAIDKGQYEGADAVGLSYWQSMRLIILPQALTHVIPGIVNTFIGLFKDTALVSIVGIFDLLGAAQSTLADAAWSTPVQGLTGYLVVATIFFIFCFGMSRYSMYMEQKLNRSHKI
ncbi:amino acid ABC transporter permease [Candidatus Ponderosibacter sp. Uisw_141_02]|jgi:general L-amino acid transport system permease protein|uniref:amino acid ABC transporter permease n=1 Tax=Candidatus Ponderosibacter sp. Uisw_141_02 TaxID=3231000 RepID=UPI003D4A223D